MDRPASLEAVLRALPYALRGSSTDVFPFNSAGEIIPEVNGSLVTALGALCEPCVLYKWIEKHISQLTPQSLVEQALHSAIREKLRAYLVFVAEFEHKNVASLAEARLLLAHPTQYLRLFCTILQCSGSTSILNTLFAHTQHGDEFLRRHAEQLYTQANAPMLLVLKRWEELGQLDLDVYHEFFVAERNPDQFELVEERIPESMSHMDALKVLERGRALHFVRAVCGDTAFSGENLTFAEIASHSNHLLLTEHKLVLHFKGLRDYMLLGNGNFVDSLFRNDKDNFLMQPVSNVGNYLASQYFLGAINDITADSHEDPAILNAVDAYVLGMESSNVQNSGTRVWEAFVGKYHLDTKPLRLIVDRKSVVKYERCFASLWRVRLSVYSLRESGTKLRMLSRVGGSSLPELEQLHLAMSTSMIELERKFYYEVVAEQWSDLMRKMTGKELTLSDIQHAHDVYLSAIVDAVASPKRAMAIQAITKLVLGLQSLIEEPEPSQEDADSILVAFEEYINALDM